MELIADLVRRRIPCCSQAACCSAGARFEHCRATSTTGRHPITDVGILFAWVRSCGACDTVSLMYPPWPCRHPPAPRPCPPVPPASSTPVALGVWLCRLASCPPRMRYKVRPAHAKRAKTGHFECAGRVLYRKWHRGARAGRVLPPPSAPSPWG